MSGMAEAATTVKCDQCGARSIVYVELRCGDRVRCAVCKVRIVITSTAAKRLDGSTLHTLNREPEVCGGEIQAHDWTGLGHHDPVHTTKPQDAI